MTRRERSETTEDGDTQMTRHVVIDEGEADEDGVRVRWSVAERTTHMIIKRRSADLGAQRD